MITGTQRRQTPTASPEPDPPDSTCDDLSHATRGEEGQYGREEIRYGQLLYRWMTLGRPSDWDSDGDGRPCEDHWPADEVDRVMNSTLRP